VKKEWLAGNSTVIFQHQFESPSWRSVYMTEYIVKTDRNGKSHIKVKFHAQVTRFKRVETLKYKGNFYNIHVDKNNNVCGIEQSIVKSWKDVSKGNRKIRVPDIVESIPQPAVMNVVRGNTYEVAIPRIMAELDKVLNS